MIGYDMLVLLMMFLMSTIIPSVVFIKKYRGLVIVFVYYVIYLFKSAFCDNDLHNGRLKYRNAKFQYKESITNDTYLWYDPHKDDITTKYMYDNPYIAVYIENNYSNKKR